MPDSPNLMKHLQTLSRKGKQSLGYKEAIQSIKLSKLVVYSKSLRSDEERKLQDLCQTSGVPYIRYEGSSVDLGNVWRKPHRVSTISINSITEDDLSKLMPFTTSPSM